MTRSAGAPTVVARRRFPTGAWVRLHLGAAGLDGADQISVCRGRVTRHRHFGFGVGPHRCLGAHLATMQLNVLVDEWLKRIPDFHTEPGFIPRVVSEDVEHLVSLPLRWTPR